MNEDIVMTYHVYTSNSILYSNITHTCMQQNPISGLNATFATNIAKPGSVAFISQSGAMCTSILDWSLQANVGFSAFISLGSMSDVNWGDLIYYLGDDPNTKAIAIYMETIGDAR